MRIRFLTNIGSMDSDLSPQPIEGEVREVSDTLAKRFISRNWAVEIPIPTPEVIQAVPVKPAIAEVKSPEIAASDKDEPPESQAERDLKSYIDRQRRKPAKPPVVPVKQPTKQEP